MRSLSPIESLNSLETQDSWRGLLLENVIQVKHADR